MFEERLPTVASTLIFHKASGWLQLACVSDFAFVGWTDMRRLNRDHRCRVAIQRSKFHLVGVAIAIDMHNGPHIARLQTFGSDVGRQNNAGMFFDHVAFHFLREYTVTNLPASSPLSTIQTL